MKFLGREEQQSQPDKSGQKEQPETKTQTSIDNVSDPTVLSSQLTNLKQSFRYKGYSHIRISEMHSFCPREQALGYLKDIKKKDFVETPLQVQFDLGSALHYWFQNHSKITKDVLFSNWVCVACGNYRLNDDGSAYFGPRPSKYLKRPCETCGAKTDATFFEEFFFRMNRPYPVVGKMDGVLCKDGVYRFIDFKSYHEAQNFPLTKDVIQIVSYAHFYEFLPDHLKLPVSIDTSTSYLMYISKKFNYSSPILTYPVKKTEEMTTKLSDQVDKVRKAQDTGEIPAPLDSCIKSGFSKGRAKDCFIKQYCKEAYDNGM